MSYIIIGTTGNFSRQLQQLIPEHKRLMLGKEIFETWNESQEIRALESKEYQIQKGDYLINTIGITSPNYSLESLRRVNLEFPKYLYHLSKKFELNLITLGSVHENYPNLFLNNNYMIVKKELKSFLEENSYANSFHFQFHTWYGGARLKKEMFLGQIITALRNNSIFLMSSGKQIREYHHIEDDALCLLDVLTYANFGRQVIEHGNPLTLQEIAFHIFSYFDRTHLLRFDLNNSQFDDLYLMTVLEPIKTKCSFRSTLDGIIKYVEYHL